MELFCNQVGDRPVIEVRGNLDSATAPKLSEQLKQLVDDGSYNLVIDLDHVDVLDAAGLASLVNGQKRAKAHEGSIRLVCNNASVLKTLRITGLTKTFPIHTTVQDAVYATD